MASQPLYRSILRQAFLLTTRHKTLWVLGFLAAFLGMGGEYEYIFNQYTNVSSGEWGGLGSSIDFLGGGGKDMVAALADAAQNLSGGTILALAIFLVLLFILGAVVIIAQGALVSGIASAESSGRFKFLEAIRIGYKSFWSLLAIIISTKLLALFVLSVVGLPLLSVLLTLDESLAVTSSSLIVFVLGLPLFVLFSLIAKFAINYRVIQKELWRTSLVKAFVLFADHWLLTVELALLIFLINILTAVVFIVAALLLSSPFILLGIMIADMTYVVVLKSLVTAALVLFLLILLLLGSGLSTFQNSVWTILFLKIKDAPAAPKLLRIIRGWREKYSN